MHGGVGGSGPHRHTESETHTRAQTPYIWINLQRASSQMPLNVAEGENHAGKEAASE